MGEHFEGMAVAGSGITDIGDLFRYLRGDESIRLGEPVGRHPGLDRNVDRSEVCGHEIIRIPELFPRRAVSRLPDEHSAAVAGALVGDHDGDLGDPPDRP